MSASSDFSSPTDGSGVLKLKSLPGYIPGMVFLPNDDEIVNEFLINKTLGKPLPSNFITDVDVYAHNPDQLPMEYENNQVWSYFFAFTTRSRSTPGGYWKAKAKASDEPIYDEDDEVVALKTSLEYYQGEAPNGTATIWKMHEYRLKSIKNSNDPRMDSLVVCKVYAKSPARIKEEQRMKNVRKRRIKQEERMKNARKRRIEEEEWMKNASKMQSGKRKAKKSRII